MAESILGLVKEAGWVVALLVLAISNAGKIADWFECLLTKIWPDLVQSRMARLEREGRNSDARHEMGGRAFTELLELYQRELADEKVERRKAQAQVLGVLERHRAQMTELVQKYEQFNANSLEVLHEVSSAIRENRILLEQMRPKLPGTSSYSDGDTYPTGADAAPGAASPE